MREGSHVLRILVAGHLAGIHLQPWFLSSHLRGINTDALPMAKIDRKAATAAAKAPEHKARAVR